jgi:hypothetical protein
VEAKEHVGVRCFYGILNAKRDTAMVQVFYRIYPAQLRQSQAQRQQFPLNM